MSSYLCRVEEYVNSPKVYSFYLVPLYTTVGVFPVLIASTLIYNIWEKKAAGYLVSKHMYNSSHVV